MEILRYKVPAQARVGSQQKMDGGREPQEEQARKDKKKRITDLKSKSLVKNTQDNPGRRFAIWRSSDCSPDRRFQ